jgi:nucleotidyltransferase/DNA polymerase involved in DNA repair
VSSSNLIQIPGIGKTFVKDFARIGIHSINDLRDRDATTLFQDLQQANNLEDHKTSKNYLYVIRMAVYYANGGRDASKLMWNAWKD